MTDGGIVGEIRLFAGVYEPRNWLFCDGSILPTSPSIILFSVIGNTFGGDGDRTFGVPNLRGYIAVGAVEGSASSAFGTAAGREHVVFDTTVVSADGPPATTVNSIIAMSGSNVQPVLGIDYIICLFGKFPARPGSAPVEGTIGEIRLFGGDYAPSGWALCDGSVVSVADPAVRYRPLFEVMATHTAATDRRHLTTGPLPQPTAARPRRSVSRPVASARQRAGTDSTDRDCQRRRHGDVRPLGRRRRRRQSPTVARAHLHHLCERDLSVTIGMRLHEPSRVTTVTAFKPAPRASVPSSPRLRRSRRRW